MSTGILTAGLTFGGATPGGLTNVTNEYNGSSWTAGGNLPTPVSGLGGSGTQTATLAYGGSAPSYTTATSLYDGTSWASVPTSLTTARTQLGSTTTSSTAALAFGGLTPSGPSNTTEIYTDAGPATVTITAS
jgi:hypothetical protein